jgi:hypothetical protein
VWNANVLFSWPWEILKTCSLHLWPRPFLAICHLVYYSNQMSKIMYLKMIIGSWTLGCSTPWQTQYMHYKFLTADLAPQIIYSVVSQLFCLLPVWMLGFMSTWLFLLLPFLGISACYGRVLFAVFHMHLKQGRKKCLHSMFNTFNGGDILLCTFCLHLSLAQESSLICRRQDCDCLLHHFHPMLSPII